MEVEEVVAGAETLVGQFVGLDRDVGAVVAGDGEGAVVVGRVGKRDPGADRDVVQGIGDACRDRVGRAVEGQVAEVAADQCEFVGLVVRVAVGGFQTQGDAETVTKGVPTSGRIANGAIIEREVKFNLGGMTKVKLTLRNPDFTTARRVAQAVNAFLGTSAAIPSDPTTINVTVPDSYRDNVVNLLTDIEQLRIEPDQLARVVIDEQTGTIVMGENVRISSVAIAQGSLTIRVTETEQVSQPGPFAEVGTTTTVDRTNIEVDEGEDQRLTVLQEGVSLQELVNGLNALGIGPRDMITILQAIKTAGALQAEIEVM